VFCPNPLCDFFLRILLALEVASTTSCSDHAFETIISMAGGVAADGRKAPTKDATRLRASVSLIYPTSAGT
jgi:hypothetical protein